jgi:Ca2+-binding EF-hand superfamily protein
MEAESKSSLSKIRDDEEQNIREVFASIDTDGSNQIDGNKLYLAAQHVKLDLERNEADELIEKLDTDKLGYINFTQFREMMINRSIVRM